MDLTEATRRVFMHHLRLIVACVVVGVLAGVTSSLTRPHEYTSSVRVMLDPQGSGTPEAVTAAADTARALITSPGIAAHALAQANADRDPTALVEGRIALEPIGGSGIVRLDVRDGDPAVAAATANALADELVEGWVAADGGAVDDVANVLRIRIDQLDADITALDEQIARRVVELSGESDPAIKRRLRVTRDALIAERDGMVQERLVLRSEVGRALVDAANRFVPRIVDPAVPAVEADPRDMMPSAALGALLGFLVGAGAAAIIETFRPTLVGDDAIAEALGAAILGNLSVDGDVPRHVGERLPLQIGIAARRAKAKTVELVSVGWPTDGPTFRTLADGLQRGGSGRDPSRSNGDLVVHPFGHDELGTNAESDTSRAMVAVLPSVIKRAELRGIVDLQNLTAWPLVGVITFRSKNDHVWDAFMKERGGRMMAGPRRAPDDAPTARPT